MDSHQHTGGIIVVHLGLRKEIAAVHQTESVNLSLELVCIFTGKRKERIELVAAASAHTVNALDTVIQLMSSHMALSRPHTGKIDHLIILVRQVYTGAHCREKCNLFVRITFKTYTSCDDRKCFINRIQKDNLCSNTCILQNQLQCLCLIVTFYISRRKSFKLWFAIVNFMLFIYKLDYMASVLPLDLICRETHISAAKSRILLLDIFQ